MAKRVPKGNRIAPWRFLMFFAALVVGAVPAVPSLGWSTGGLVAFDIAAILFLLSCLPAFRYDAPTMRKTAIENDANRVLLLVLSALLSVVVLAAIVAELGGKGALGAADKLLITASLVFVWLFANAVYTLHYAHLFYTDDDKGKVRAGLDFPGTKEPLFADFVYFSFTLGVAVQTSDVAVTSPHIRNVATVHCVAGFFFNLGVLALTINVLGSS